MSERTYSELLRDGRWQQLRLRVFERDGFACLFCGDQNFIQVHHKKYERGRLPWEYPLVNFLTLCGRCHQAVTDYQARAKDLMSGMNLGKLSAAIDALERIAASSFGEGVFQHAPDPMEHERSISAIRAALERLEAEGLNLTGLEWTRERSRRVDVIDFEIAGMWDRLAETGAASA